jgi:hypothetical protein
MDRVSPLNLGMKGVAPPRIAEIEDIARHRRDRENLTDDSHSSRSFTVIGKRPKPRSKTAGLGMSELSPLDLGMSGGGPAWIW